MGLVAPSVVARTKRSWESHGMPTLTIACMTSSKILAPPVVTSVTWALVTLAPSAGFEPAVLGCGAGDHLSVILARARPALGGAMTGMARRPAPSPLRWEIRCVRSPPHMLGTCAPTDTCELGERLEVLD